MGRKKQIENEQILDIARQVFVETGIGSSTREIAKRAMISEAVIFQRYPTKADLFFAAMVPPALDVEKLLLEASSESDVCKHIEQIVYRMVDYFRELVPIILPLITHPDFDYEKFNQQNPDAPVNRLQNGLNNYLNEQQRLGKVNSHDVRPYVLLMITSLHSIAIFEKMGVHGGKFSEESIRAMVKAVWYGLSPQ